MSEAEILVFLLALMAALVVASHRLELPYPVLLVLGGLALSFVPGLPPVRLNPNLVLYFFLPPLLYPAALFTSWRDFRRNLRPILFLAIGLVLFTMVSIAVLAHAIVPELSWAAAFALGAIVSPTDTVAAEAVIRRLGVPPRVDAIIEGESLVNDATALVALRFAILALTTGTFSLGQASVSFLIVSAGGIAVGLAVGFALRWVQSHLDDPPVNISLSLLTPFLAYLPAERLHFSGVLATVTVGIFMGWHSPLVLSARTRLQATAFWEMAVFLINGFIFIAIGLQLPGILRQLESESWARLLGMGAAVSVAVVLVRIGWVFAATYLRAIFPSWRKRDPIPPWPNTLLVSWAGMRGVISLAAAFGLPLALEGSGRPFPARGYILYLTFCVILVTLVLQGLTLPWLIRRFGLSDDHATDEEERGARKKANEAALQLIERLASDCEVPRGIAQRLEAEYQERLGELERCFNCGTEEASGEVATPHYRRLQFEALQVERQTIIQLRNEHVINDEALRRIQRDLDLAEARLTGG